MEIKEEIESLKIAPLGDPYKNRVGYIRSNNSFIKIDDAPTSRIWAALQSKQFRVGFCFVENMLTVEDFERFDRYYRGKNIKDYALCYFPSLGKYDFVPRNCIRGDILYFLGAESRREILWRLARGQQNVFDEYLDMWKTKSIEMEYYMWLFHLDRYSNHILAREGLMELLAKNQGK